VLIEFTKLFWNLGFEVQIDDIARNNKLLSKSNTDDPRYLIHWTALLDVYYRFSSIFFPAPRPFLIIPAPCSFSLQKNLIDSERPVHLQQAANARVKLRLLRSFYEEDRNDGSVALNLRHVYYMSRNRVSRIKKVIVIHLRYFSLPVQTSVI